MILKKTSQAGRQYKIKRRVKHGFFVVVCVLLAILGFFAAGPILSLFGR